MSIHGVPQGVTNPPPLPPSEQDPHAVLERGKLGIAPGTMVLVIIFLAAFVTYYFANWKLLSFLWQIG